MFSTIISTFIGFTTSVMFMSNNACFIQYHFNILLFTHNSNIFGSFNIWNKKIFFNASIQLRKSTCFKIELDLNDLNPGLSFEIFSYNFLKRQTSNLLNIPQVYNIPFYHITILLIRLSNPATILSLTQFYILWSF